MIDDRSFIYNGQWKKKDFMALRGPKAAYGPLMPWSLPFFIVKKKNWKIDYIRSKIYDRIEKSIFEDRSIDHDRKSIFDRNH